MNKKQIKTLTSVIVVIIALAVGYFGLMVSFIAGTTMQLYLYWIMLGTMISLVLFIKNETL